MESEDEVETLTWYIEEDLMDAYSKLGRVAGSYRSSNPGRSQWFYEIQDKLGALLEEYKPVLHKSCEVSGKGGSCGV